jgi:hypothetical protein
MDLTVMKMRFLQAVQYHKTMNIKYITLAAYTLDPKFCGNQMSEEQWNIAMNLITNMVSVDNRLAILDDLAEFRS